MARHILVKILAVESEGLVTDRAWATREGTQDDCLQASWLAELGVQWCCEQGQSSEEKAEDRGLGVVAWSLRYLQAISGSWVGTEMCSLRESDLLMYRR